MPFFTRDILAHNIVIKRFVIEIQGSKIYFYCTIFFIAILCAKNFTCYGTAKISRVNKALHLTTPMGLPTPRRVLKYLQRQF